MNKLHVGSCAFTEWMFSSGINLVGKQCHCSHLSIILGEFFSIMICFLYAWSELGEGTSVVVRHNIRAWIT